MTPSITINSRWWGEHIRCEVMVTRVTDRDVSYAAVDGPFAGTVPQWKFLDDFQPRGNRGRNLGQFRASWSAAQRFGRAFKELPVRFQRWNLKTTDLHFKSDSATLQSSKCCENCPEMVGCAASTAGDSCRCVSNNCP